MLSLFFIGLLNGMHSPLQFTMESEENDRLPFLDVLVIRCDDVFLTTIYMKPSFIGLYVQWEQRFSGKEQKLALIYSLATRAKRICSQFLLSSLLDDFFISNEYPNTSK